MERTNISLEKEIEDLRRKIYCNISMYSADGFACHTAWSATMDDASDATIDAAWFAAGYPFEDVAKQEEIDAQCKLILEFL